MSGWKAVLVFIATAYVAVVVLMYFGQRGLMYFPEKLRVAPAEAGFPEAEEVLLKTRDGEQVIVWHVPPREDQPVVLYFHGNGGALRYRVDRFRALTAAGGGLVALSYRGYGGSTGHPSESGLLEDARVAYEFATSRYPAGRIVLWGESLGTGVAVATAAERPVARLVLEAPFISAVDIAARAYPFVPVRFLMKDQFRSDLRIANVTVPVLVLHGDRDDIVPIASGERLYSLIKGPKRFMRIEGGGHENLGGYGVVEAARKFAEEAFDQKVR